MRPIVEHEHTFEAQPGIPGRLPSDEHILWQGSPRWTVLAVRVLHIRLIALYFVAIAAWRLLDGMAGSSLSLETMAFISTPLILAAITIGILCAYAWGVQKTTIYTITNKRLLMKVGVALDMTLNLPFAKIASASILTFDKTAKTGNLSIEPLPGERVGWLFLWPHVRPWFMSRAQPTFRSIKDVDQASAILTEALQKFETQRSAEETETADIMSPANMAATPIKVRIKNIEEDRRPTAGIVPAE